VFVHSRQGGSTCDQLRCLLPCARSRGRNRWARTSEPCTRVPNLVGVPKRNDTEGRRGVLFVLTLGVSLFCASDAHCLFTLLMATLLCVATAGAITIDGDLSEWTDVRGFTMAQEKFFFVGQGMSSAKWMGPSDLSATFKIQWDARYVYIAVEVMDDHVTEPHGSLVKGIETGSWDDDGVELLFDNDGCGMPRLLHRRPRPP